MSDSTQLERRYRRLLACYPAAFRREHEQEILSVLMEGAAEGQQRPRLADAVNLLTHAIPMRLRQLAPWNALRRLRPMKLQPSAYQYRRPRLWIRVRVGIGISLVVLSAILLGYGYWWGALLLAAAALHFYFAYCLRHPASN
jgi:hypothetical protein